ncbi:hypothetical protein ASD54_04650 [Rhizobium sp. Root149]|uniref:hypothetical protein n=1 Tax=Rhizobium sp. Root149 TaxID=1736473 RepID=UPI00071236B0|nr:hypothetical protein [Rhizobium sp. Root149]KQZ54621.1 hypothetical protein ASD54_04650 [Rhizobium sp. Root149]
MKEAVRMKTHLIGLIGLFLSTTPVPGADEAVRFGRFWGAVLAIEDACPKYFIRTDAIMGNHLKGEQYAYAKSIVEDERKKAAKSAKKLGCDASAKEILKLTELSFFEVWEIKD